MYYFSMFVKINRECQFLGPELVEQYFVTGSCLECRNVKQILGLTLHSLAIANQFNLES